MPIVGLTGGFGTGKSFAASVFKKLGADIIDADELGHKALKKGSATYKRIVAVFGKSILDKNNFIDRIALARKVFKNKKSISKLNRLVHPQVVKEIRGRIRGTAQNDVLVIDAPLICETKLTALMDVLVVVKASKKNQVERCVKKFGMKKADVCRRVACQMPLEEKAKKADYIIDNNGTRKETVEQVERIWRDIKKG